MATPVLDYRPPDPGKPGRWWLRLGAQLVVGFVLGVGVCFGLMFFLGGYDQHFSVYSETSPYREDLALWHILTSRAIVLAILAALVAAAVRLWRRKRWRGLLPGLLIGYGTFALPLGACFFNITR